MQSAMQIVTRENLFRVGFAAFVAIIVLGALLASPRRTQAQRGAEPKDYVGDVTCKLCHNREDFGEQWTIWRNSPHARAYETLLNEKSLQIAKERNLKVAPSEAGECLRCHVTAYDRDTGIVPPPLRMTEGVQCETCHGPGSLHVPDGRHRWINRDASVDTLANIIRPDGRACVRCHRRQSPTWDPERYALPGGQTTGFDFQQAFAKIAHPILVSMAEGDAQ
jgi:cytochrome c553